MLSWKEEIGRTWLADRCHVQSFDLFVRKCLAKHRGLSGSSLQDVSAVSVESLTTDIREFGEVGAWFWTLSSTCLLAELVFGATHGGTFQAGRFRRNMDLHRDLVPLSVLRNAVFHPAHHAYEAGAGLPQTERLIEWMEGNGEGNLAQQLSASWAFLGHRPIASFGLRKLDSAGRIYACQQRIACGCDK